MLTPTRSGRLASLAALMMTLLLLATTAVSTGEAEARLSSTKPKPFCSPCGTVSLINRDDSVHR